MPFVYCSFFFFSRSNKNRHHSCITKPRCHRRQRIVIQESDTNWWHLFAMVEEKIDSTWKQVTFGGKNKLHLFTVVEEEVECKRRVNGRKWRTVWGGWGAGGYWAIDPAVLHEMLTCSATRLDLGLRCLSWKVPWQRYRFCFCFVLFFPFWLTASNVSCLIWFEWKTCCSRLAITTLTLLDVTFFFQSCMCPWMGGWMVWLS